MDKIKTYVKNKWYLVLGIILFPLIWAIIWFSYPNKHSEVATLFVLSITFVAIVWYSIETMLLRKINQKSFYEDRFNKLLDSFLTTHRLIYFVKYEPIYGTPKTEKHEFYGDEALKYCYTILLEIYNRIETKDQLERSVNAFNEFYMDEANNYNHLHMFFNIFENILLNLKKLKEKSPEEFDYYKTSFQNSMSSYSISILFYFGLSNYCKTINLIDEFKIFYDIITGDELIKIKHLAFYKQFEGVTKKGEGIPFKMPTPEELI